MSRGMRSALAPIGVAVLATAVAVLVRLPFQLLQDSRNPLPLYLAILAAGLLGGRRAGLLAAGLCGVALGVSDNISSPQEPPRVVGFLIGGGLLGWLSGALHDTRVEVLAQAARAARLHAELDALLGHAPIGFALFGRDRRALRANPALAALRGEPAEWQAGRSIDEVLPPGPGSAAGWLERVFADGQRVLNQEWHGRLLSGEERTWLISVYPVRPNSPEAPVEGAGLLLLDVTERRRLEDELRRHAADLVENDRRKDVFLAMLSHELRNPLATLRNCVDLLRAGQPANEHLGAMFRRQLGQVTRLVDDLLETARINRGQIALRREVIDLGQVVDQALEMARPLLDGHGHLLTVERDGGPVLIDGDPVRLTQVLVNLLHNAARYTPPGGHIHLEVRAGARETVIRVSDNGMGIRPEMLGRIFELFQQGDQPPGQAPGGLGLGLTLVRRLVELHGGTVTASSPGPGQGSTFEVRLPILSGTLALPHLQPSAQGLPAPRSAPPRILVVDDNSDAAESLAMLLGCRGHEVRVAGDGPTALEEVSRWAPDVVVLDIGLPGMDGFEVARCLCRQHGSGRPRLVALTGFGQEDDRRRGRDAGFDEFLVKPADPDDLFRALQVERG